MLSQCLPLHCDHLSVTLQVMYKAIYSRLPGNLLRPNIMRRLHLYPDEVKYIYICRVVMLNKDFPALKCFIYLCRSIFNLWIFYLQYHKLSCINEVQWICVMHQASDLVFVSAFKYSQTGFDQANLYFKARAEYPIYTVPIVFWPVYKIHLLYFLVSWLAFIARFVYSFSITISL